ncbi:molybdenum cofactor synthesis protein cinnamon [Toxorhynchites rutilus septentrionalis]|uniref:molybdenum cofactor synthesis protein cinnamon n=1 Tax=Toxorhynchites rutilus septentrionalis TaxID=329112 RepID=UPI002479D0B6|nr:molybdenum cofactor synthesis protein cinnamon [Toxorhynchites rutilus septentrionalis]
MKYAVITVSDTCSNGTATDTSGPLLISLVESKLNGTVVNYLVVPDDIDTIKQSLIYSSDVLQASAIFTTGGTGFAPRDVTPEATKAVLTKEAPQLSLAMTLKSMEKTKFACLSRAVCGIRNRTLIVNFPGSKKAVEECFYAINDVIPHMLQLLTDNVPKVRETHRKMQSHGDGENVHVCPHATGKGGDDRNSPFPMIDVGEALKIILSAIDSKSSPKKQMSRVNIPPFRASIKDGYAMKSIGGKGVKRVIKYVAAGSGIIRDNFNIDECYKINTGAPVPDYADCVVQVEDTKLISSVNDAESIVEILIDPTPDLDIRPIGSDLRMGEEVFEYRFPLSAAQKSLLASIGETPKVDKLKIAIISTGDELVHPYGDSSQGEPLEGKIYDSNTTMLTQLLVQFGFGEDQCSVNHIVIKDDYTSFHNGIESFTDSMHVIICTGGVSMGDKDFVKPVLEDLQYDLKFGRVNMKPGKPFTFASKGSTLFFGLPGNPVSAFVTFHIFALPALRKYLSSINGASCTFAKCCLPNITVELDTECYYLDPRPECVRASITSKNGKLYARVTDKQISSRLKSIVEADVLLHFPARTPSKTTVVQGELLTASVIRTDFISAYE